MTGTKILWGQMLGALLAALAGLWGATEWMSMSTIIGRPVSAINDRLPASASRGL
jgi:hypothetical protein